MVALRPRYTTRSDLKVRKLCHQEVLPCLFPYLGRYTSWNPSSSPHFLWIFNSKRNSTLWRTVQQVSRMQILKDTSYCYAMAQQKAHVFIQNWLFQTASITFTSSQSLNSESLAEREWEQRPFHKTAWFQDVLAMVSCFVWYKHCSRQLTCRQKFLKKVNAQVLLKWAPTTMKIMAKPLKNLTEPTTIHSQNLCTEVTIPLGLHSNRDK